MPAAYAGSIRSGRWPADVVNEHKITKKGDYHEK